MVLAGLGPRAGAQRGGYRPASLGGQGEAAHRAVEADQLRRLGCRPAPPHHGSAVGGRTDTTVRGVDDAAPRSLTAAAQRDEHARRVPAACPAP